MNNSNIARVIASAILFLVNAIPPKLHKNSCDMISNTYSVKSREA